MFVLAIDTDKDNDNDKENDKDTCEYIDKNTAKNMDPYQKVTAPNS